MFKWLIDRQIRAELADLAHAVAKQNGKIEALEESVLNFKMKWRTKAEKALAAQEATAAESALGALTPEEQQFINGLSPYERDALMQKLNNGRVL